MDESKQENEKACSSFESKSNDPRRVEEVLELLKLKNKLSGGNCGTYPAQIKNRLNLQPKELTPILLQLENEGKISYHPGGQGQMIKWEKVMKNRNELIVLDIETTGFHPVKEFIVELGIVLLNLQTGEITELFDAVFKEPGLNKSHHKAWIFEKGYMTIEEVRKGKSIEVYRNEINDILAPYQGQITAWNRKFDKNFLVEKGFSLGKDIPCPMLKSMNFFEIPHANGRGGYKWPKAQEAWDILFPDNPFTEEHRGLSDAKMEAKIIFELYKRGIYKPYDNETRR